MPHEHYSPQDLVLQFSDGQVINLESCRGEADLPFLQALRGLNVAAGPDTSVADALQQQLAILQTIERKVDQIMATQAEFQAKINEINANTTASAAAAQANADTMKALRAQLDQVLTDAGVSAAEEASILAQLDGSIATSAALKTFLEATAAGPVTQPEPTPVPEPPVV